MITLAEDQIVEISSYAFLLNPCLTKTDKLVISQQRNKAIISTTDTFIQLHFLCLH